MNIFEDVTIPLTDRHAAYGRLYGSWHQSLVIYVHSLGTNSLTTVLPFEAARFLTSRGFSFLGLNLYDYRPGARRLKDCTLNHHVSDLNTVIAHARAQGSPAIHAIGHSLGGLTVLLSYSPHLASAILLDPSHPEVQVFRTDQYVQELGYYLQSGSSHYLVNPAMVDSFSRLRMDEIIRPDSRPSLIISAGGNLLVDGAKDYVNRLRHHGVMTHHVIVPGADHNFTTLAAQQPIWAAIGQWLDNPNH